MISGNQCYRILQTGKTIYTEHEHILNVSVLKFVYNSQPKLWGFVFTYPDTHDIFISFKIDTHDYIGCTIEYMAVFPDSAILVSFVSISPYPCV